MTDSLVDSNIVVYAYQDELTGKGMIAKALIERLAIEKSGVLSTQVLVEVSSVLLRRSKPTPDISKIQAAIRTLSKLFTILKVNPESVTLALDAVKQFQMSFWDALIWAVAKQNNIPEILTEDMPGGKTEIDGVRYRNPFALQTPAP